MVLLEIYTDGGLPMEELGNAEVMANVQSGYTAPRPMGCPVNIFKVMLACWQMEPVDRPTFAHLVATLSEDGFIDAAHTPAPRMDPSALTSSWGSAGVYLLKKESRQSVSSIYSLNPEMDDDVEGGGEDTMLMDGANQQLLYGSPYVCVCLCVSLVCACMLMFLSLIVAAL
jgi:hypothetical protein